MATRSRNPPHTISRERPEAPLARCQTRMPQRSPQHLVILYLHTIFMQVAPCLCQVLGIMAACPHSKEEECSMMPVAESCIHLRIRALAQAMQRGLCRHHLLRVLLLVLLAV